MAIWQFSMHLVPVVELAQICPDLASAVPGEVYDEVAWWSTSQPPPDLARRLSAALPEVQGWDSRSRQWGLADTTTVSVHYARGRVHSVHARLDLRQPVGSALDLLATLALHCNASWVGGDARQRIPLGQTREALVSAIKASDAARFVVDLRGFMSSFAAKGREGA
jgi:hypothetical protein